MQSLTGEVQGLWKDTCLFSLPSAMVTFVQSSLMWLADAIFFCWIESIIATPAGQLCLHFFHESFLVTLLLSFQTAVPLYHFG